MNTLFTSEEIDKAKEQICNFLNITIYPFINPNKIEKLGINFIEDKTFSAVHTPHEYFKLETTLYGKKTEILIPDRFVNRLDDCLENHKNLISLVEHHQEKIKIHHENIKADTASYDFDFPDELYIKIMGL